MLWRKRKKEKKLRRAPRLEHFVEYDVKWEPVTQEQIDVFQQRQELWEYLVERNANYGSRRKRNNYPDDPFYDPLREFDHDLEVYCTKQIKWNRIISQTGGDPGD